MSSERLEDLRANARYARERYHLYRAKTYGSRPTSEARLRELQRGYEYGASDEILAVFEHNLCEDARAAAGERAGDKARAGGTS
jgi:hypothetical protein